MYYSHYIQHYDRQHHEPHEKVIAQSKSEQQQQPATRALTTSLNNHTMQTITTTNHPAAMRATWYLPLSEPTKPESGEKYDAIKMTLSYTDGGYSSRKGIQVHANRVTIEPCGAYSMETTGLGNGARVYIKTLSRKSQKAYNDAHAFFESKAAAIITAIAAANPGGDCYESHNVYCEQLQPLAGILDN